MIKEENRIIFKEIKTYEDAYYYNTDPNERMLYDKKEVKIKKKKDDFIGKLLAFIGEIAEGALELIFSIID